MSEAPALEGSAVALLLIDVVNPMDFEGGERLLPRAERAAERIAQLKRRAREAGVAVIYVNDNFDSWHLGFRELVLRFESRNVPGRRIIRLLEPELDRDFYILKPRHSGFFHTSLEVLLGRLQAQVLVLAGFATDICVLFTATDAYMRGYDVVVAKDCVAAERESDQEHALEQMARLLKADVVSSDEVDFDRLARRAVEVRTRPVARGLVVRP